MWRHLERSLGQLARVQEGGLLGSRGSQPPEAPAGSGRHRRLSSRCFGLPPHGNRAVGSLATHWRAIADLSHCPFRRAPCCSWSGILLQHHGRAFGSCCGASSTRDTQAILDADVLVVRDAGGTRLSNVGLLSQKE